MQARLKWKIDEAKAAAAEASGTEDLAGGEDGYALPAGPLLLGDLRLPLSSTSHEDCGEPGKPKGSFGSSQPPLASPFLGGPAPPHPWATLAGEGLRPQVSVFGYDDDGDQGGAAANHNVMAAPQPAVLAAEVALDPSASKGDNSASDYGHNLVNSLTAELRAQPLLHQGEVAEPQRAVAPGPPDRGVGSSGNPFVESPVSASPGLAAGREGRWPQDDAVAVGDAEGSMMVDGQAAGLLTLPGLVSTEEEDGVQQGGPR